MTQEDLERFAAIVAAAEREKLAHWMRNCGYATGHGDSVESLLDHLGTQIAEGLLMEREAISDEYAARLQGDLENGVRWLNEKAASEFNKKYPQIASFNAWLNARGNT